MITYSIKNNWLFIEDSIENANVNSSLRIDLDKIDGYEIATGTITFWTQGIAIPFNGDDAFLSGVKAILDDYLIIG